MRELKGQTGKLRAVAYSPDGSRLATAGDAGTTKLWDLATGKIVATIYQPDPPSSTSADERRVGRLVFSADGQLLATATVHVRLWNMQTLNEVRLPPGLGSWSRCVSMAFTPDDAFLIITRAGGVGHYPHLGSRVLTWNRKTGQFETPFGDEGSLAEAMAVSAKANLLAVALQHHGKCCVRLWGLASHKVEATLSLPPIPMSHLRAAMQDVAFSPDGNTLAVAAGTQVFVWDVPGRQLRRCITAHEKQVETVAFAPSGTLLATGSQDGSVRLWDVGSLGERAAYNWEIGKVRAVAFSPDGMTAAAVGEKSKVIIWDVD